MTPAVAEGEKVEQLTRRISGAIMTGELAVGTWLRQETLAERFGVSRQPVREALRQLHAAGLVEIHPRRGAVVHGPSAREIRGAYLVRAELEGLAAELAATGIADAQLTALHDADAAFRDITQEALDSTLGDLITGDFGWGRANHAFHQVILDAADVPFLLRTIESVYRVVPRNLTWSAIRTRDALQANIAQHEAIFRSIERRDPVKARAAMREHIRLSGELIADWFEARRDRATDTPAA